MKRVLFVVFQLATVQIWAKDYDYDYDAEPWRCGAPLVQELRAFDPSNRLRTDLGNSFQLKESLRQISELNMDQITARVGTLSVKEQQHFDLIKGSFNAPIVHRTTLETAQMMLTTGEDLASSTKRKAGAFTPEIEQELFAGHDCIFTSIGIPDGTERYGSTILRLKKGLQFGWATIRSGFKWIQHDLKQDPNGNVDTTMRLEFSEQVITDEHWDAAMAFKIIENVRAGTTFLNQGKSYNNATMLTHLLSQKTVNLFWEKVQEYRLAYMEGKHIENISVDTLEWIKFDKLDQSTVKSWDLSSYFSSLIKFQEI